MAACGIVLIATAEILFPHDAAHAFSVLFPFGTWLAATGFALEVVAAALVGNKERVERALSPVVTLGLCGFVYLWLQGALFFR